MIFADDSRPTLFVVAGTPADDALPVPLATPADVQVTVAHGDCGNPACQRPQGHVRTSVVWLDPAVTGLAFQARLEDDGFPLCEQSIERIHAQILAARHERKK